MATSYQAQWETLRSKGIEAEPSGSFPKHMMRKIGRILHGMRSAGEWLEMEAALGDLGLVLNDPFKWSSAPWCKELGILALACLLRDKGDGIPDPRPDNLELATKLLDLLVASKLVRKRSVMLVMMALVRRGLWDQMVKMFEEILVRHFNPDATDLITLGVPSMPKEIWKSLLGVMADAKLSIHLPHLVSPWTEADPADLTWVEDPRLQAGTRERLFGELTSYLKDEYGRRGAEAFEMAMKEIFTNGFDIVIDGANVLYHGTQTLDTMSFARLNSLCHTLVFKGFKPLVVLNARHSPRSGCRGGMSRRGGHATPRGRGGMPRPLDPQANFFSKWKDKILLTSRGLNDDWFAIGAALKADCFLLTNDFFKDHVVAWAKEGLEEDALFKPRVSGIKPWSEASLVRFTARPHATLGWLIDLTLPSPVGHRVHRLVPVLHPPMAGVSPPTYSFAMALGGKRDRVAVI